MSGTKSDIWMPIYIGDLLGDTQHLTNEQFGIYHKIFYHQWRHGHFSGDDLWAIAGFSTRTFGSASSTLQEELKQAFSSVLAPIEQLLSKDPDGLWYSRRCDFEKANWTHKKRVFTERARKGGLAKARRIREDQEKLAAEKAASSSASSVLEGMLESCTSPSHTEEQKPEPTPTPLMSATRAGIDSPPAPSTSAARPSPRQRGQSPRQLGRSPRQLGVSPRQQGRSPRQLGTSPRQHVDKAKPPDFAPGAFQNGLDRGSAHHRANGVRPKQVKPLPGHQKKPVEAADADPRRRSFRDEVQRFWAAQNPDLPAYRFTTKDERALNELLEHNPEMTLPMLQACLRNRAQSQVARSAAPYRWLRGVIEYAGDALDKFHKPLKVARVF